MSGLPALPLGLPGAPRQTRVARAAAGPELSGVTASQRDFADTLGIANRRQDGPSTPEEQARDAAERLVSIAFVQPVLERLRESDETAEPFAPGPAERQMRTLSDAQAAIDLVRRADWPIVDRLARDMLSRARAAGAIPATDARPATET